MLRSTCNEIIILKAKKQKTNTNILKNGSLIKTYTFKIVNDISEKSI